MKFSEVQSQIIDLIKRSEKILVLPSTPVDGDAIGSAVSMYLALTKLGKNVTVVCNEVVPDVLKFLPNSEILEDKLLTSKDLIITLDTRKVKVEQIKSNIKENKVNIIVTPKEGRFTEDHVGFEEGKEEYDLIITVDTADLKQLRGVYEENMDMFHEVPVINIDHHISNEYFGKVNYVDIMSASATELLVPLLEKMEEEFEIDLIDEDIATLLLTGIITDTGSFQNANTTPKAFAHAAQLIAYGARQQEIIQHIYKTKQLSQLKLWGRLLSKIQTDDKYKIVWSTVTRQDFKETQSKEEETGDIIDELMTNAPGAEIVVLLKEKAEGTISGSIRTTSPTVDASAIAEMFGGGGHNQAAGFRIPDGDFTKHEVEIIERIRDFQKERLGVEEEDVDEKEDTTPIIDVEKLISRVKEAEKAQEAMSKVSQESSVEPEKEEDSNLNLREPKHQSQEAEGDHVTIPDVIYKFED
ncbi:bifunctional oligoribonuclease/PAP phosphatase NrnA [Candidatus Peregrinibacteria bacterium]|jgi:bifunctional oligoribonuclease and PAP phosphatase NrnA|nr:bifunctional oligoribonuclease/PAP phosphatase NrnA [Candidatus Peregrinibacteria bacterium]MBT4056504.1 bifunctional oligoribonuclease/PAP phosphatase NrnA [Candidatus Peregrinibacteria bacterium]